MYLNSWSDDWATTAADPNTDQMPTIENIRRAIREFQEKRKGVDPGPDVWVLTRDEFETLKQYCEDHYPPMWRSDLSSDPWTLYSIRIETFSTKEEVRARVIELAANGVKVGFLAEESRECCSD